MPSSSRPSRLFPRPWHHEVPSPFVGQECRSVVVGLGEFSHRTAATVGVMSQTPVSELLSGHAWLRQTCRFPERCSNKELYEYFGTLKVNLKIIGTDRRVLICSVRPILVSLIRARRECGRPDPHGQRTSKPILAFLCMGPILQHMSLLYGTTVELY